MLHLESKKGKTVAMDSRVELKVVGIAASQIQMNMFALLMAEVGGRRHIPIIVAAPEAYAISVYTEHLTPPRPIPHDLMCNMAAAFGISIKEVRIYREERGVFFSEIILKGEDREISLDSRTSDAAAIALRSKCPIYTTREIMESKGIIIEVISESDSSFVLDVDNPAFTVDDITVEELERQFNRAIEREAYELAAKIKKQIDIRKKNS